jgi:transmembrane sensor
METTMTNSTVHLEQAVDWLIRRNSPDFTGWTELADWLEAEPANAEAFARLAVMEAEVADRLVGMVPGELQPDTSPQAPRRPSGARWDRRLALAAALLAAAFALVFLRPHAFVAPGYETIATAPGARQAILIDRGARVTLNGQTRFAMERGNRRIARLLYGEASFDVRHEPSNPFEVGVGYARIVDVGTRFNVRFDGKETQISVAAGAVEYQAKGMTVRLGAGHMLKSGPDEVRTSSVDPSTVGSWTEGRLIYRGDPMATVAADLQRNTGVPIAVDPAIAATPVTAVIQLSPTRGEMPPHLESLLGVKLMRQGKGWLLKSAK